MARRLPRRLLVYLLSLPPPLFWPSLTLLPSGNAMIIHWPITSGFDEFGYSYGSYACSKQFSRLDILRQHAQTVHADKAAMNEAMMRELMSLHASTTGTVPLLLRCERWRLRQIPPRQGDEGKGEDGSPTNRTAGAGTEKRPSTKCVKASEAGGGVRGSWWMRDLGEGCGEGMAMAQRPGTCRGNVDVDEKKAQAQGEEPSPSHAVLGGSSFRGNNANNANGNSFRGDRGSNSFRNLRSDAPFCPGRISRRLKQRKRGGFRDGGEAQAQSFLAAGALFSTGLSKLTRRWKGGILSRGWRGFGAMRSGFGVSSSAAWFVVVRARAECSTFHV
ncbi:hypothetical protein B0H13DRAFT_2280600 [Mycena leptocephala]|nr:hypothetical protein B0H13DRAFT_2280600 [Mycena leptocephala]